MSVRLGLLGLLRAAPGHGYDLKLRHDGLLDPDRPVQPAQVYATLGRLERDGLISLVGAAGEGGAPAKRVYQATDRGAEELEGWLAEPVAPEPHLHTVLAGPDRHPHRRARHPRRPPLPLLTKLRSQ